MTDRSDFVPKNSEIFLNQMFVFKNDVKNSYTSDIIGCNSARRGKILLLTILKTSFWIFFF